MGLAAGQARLLTITARKSDCEFASMRLSHQKIALSRELADLSNEYQNSLNQTTLAFDYYGTGDTAMALSYGLLMEPSQLNNYSPIILTDSIGRTILNSRYAAAARAAGIPQEGFGSLPSEAVRNDFMMALAGCNIITNELANAIMATPYNQATGFGGGSLAVVETQEITYAELLGKLKNSNSANKTITYESLPKMYDCKNVPKKNCRIGLGIMQTGAAGWGEMRVEGDNGGGDALDGVLENGVCSFNLADLLTGKSKYYLEYESMAGEQSPVFGIAMMQDYLAGNGGFVDWLAEAFADVLEFDDRSSKALAYALKETKELLYPKDKNNDSEYSSWGATYGSVHDKYLKKALADGGWGEHVDENTEWKDSLVRWFLNPVSTVNVDKDEVEEFKHDYVYRSDNYVGFYATCGNKDNGKDRDDHSTAGISLNNIAKVFLTYFTDYMDGLAATDIYGSEKYYVKKGALGSSKLVNDKSTFTISLGATVSTDDLAYAGCYDSLFNQICSRGWTEDSQITNPEYLHQMLKNGMMYISKMKDDNYYYQVNYSTDSYIKEIDDESFIAKAEAKYNTEKAKLNAKEETLDMKMKNLDTEISSLSTEYDTIKNTISKNIEKSFKRFNA